MKKIKLITAVLFFAIAISSCSSVKSLSKTKIKLIENTIKLEFSNKVSMEGNFHAVLTNVSEDDIYLQKPGIKQFFRLNQDKWERVHIIQCPCGAQCSPPAPFIKLAANASYEFDWNIEEGACVSNEQGLKVADTHNAEKGKYRMKYSWGLSSDEFLEYFLEFEIE